MELNSQNIKKTKVKSKNKLGIRHYINTLLKGEVIEINSKAVKVYPLYVQLTYKGETVRFRSETSIFNNEIEISSFPESLLKKIHYEEEKIRYCFSLYIEEPIENRLSEMLARYGFDFMTEITEHVNLRFSDLLFDEFSVTESDPSLANYKPEKRMSDVAASTILGSQYKASSNDLIELYSDIFPNILKLRQSFKSKIWNFDTFYNYFKINVKSEIPIFSDVTPLYTVYEYSTGEFQKEFLKFYQYSQTAEDIISDMEYVL